MVVAGLTMAVAVHDGARVGQSIASGGFLAVTIFLGPVLGAAIGFMQVIFESRQGHWALLVHRPISRNRIFMGKVAAGLTLYFGAMLIPFLFSALWAQIPGNVGGPFRWGMAVPGLIDILTGTVYYFAGMIVARRSAKWYASRCLPLVAAFLCSVLVHELYDASTALLIIAVAASLMFAAARGAFIAGGEYKPQHWIAKTSLGVALLVGMVVAGIVTVMLIASFVPRQDNRPNNTRFTSHQLLRDGRVVVSEYIGGKITSVSDLDGTPQQDMLEQIADARKIRLYTLSPPNAQISLNPKETNRRRYRNPHRRPWRINQTTRWYYMRDIGRFEGYDEQTRMSIGSIGTSGVAKPDQNPTDRFTGEWLTIWSEVSGREMIVMTSGIYEVNFARRTVEPFIIPEPGTRFESSREFSKSSYGMGGTDEHEGHAIVTRNGILLLDPDLRVLATLPLDFQPPAYTYVNIYKLDEPDTYAFWYSPTRKQADAGAVERPRPLVIYGLDGQRVSSIEVPADERVRLSLSIPRGIWGLIIPPGPSLCFQTLPQVNNPMIRYFQAPLQRSEINMIVCMLLAGVVSLVVNLRLARRNAKTRGRRVLWATLGLLLGPSGVLLMLCMQSWPAKLRCDGCGVARLVSLFKCEHCGVGFAPPARDGTEIFD